MTSKYMYQAIITRDGVLVATITAATALGAELKALDCIEDAEEDEDYLGEEYDYQVEAQPAVNESVETIEEKKARLYAEIEAATPGYVINRQQARIAREVRYAEKMELLRKVSEEAEAEIARLEAESVKRCGTCGEEKPASHFTNGECNDCYFADDELSPDDITAIDEAMAQPDMGPYTAEELTAMVEETSAEPSQEARLILFLEGATMKVYDESLYCQECGKVINVQEDKFLNGHCEDCYTGNVDVSDEAQDALQRAWDELQRVPSLVEEETHQIALQTEMEARDAVCSEAFSDFLNAELERELQAALNISSCWDIESPVTQERLLALNAMREQGDRETAEFYRIMAEA